MRIWLRILFWLNVLDTILTIVAVSLRWAKEANPLMDILLQRGPMLFGAGKLAIVGLGLVFFWKARHSSWALPAVISLVGVYALVVSYEILMIVLIASL